ncbi:FecR domain-containing protein [Corallibacter sp.]|uniref:FecR domain-containing protein n=1 Tax=Corallibacter sp. TaxID=2038084 RepID=UPI003AB78CC8
MEKDELLKKWLNHELSPEELQAFKQREDYTSLVRLSDSLKQFKAPEFNTNQALETALKNRNTHKQKNQWIKPLLRIAALLAICFCTYFYTTTLDKTYNTYLAEKQEILLPDNSETTLNAYSSVKYNKHSWSDNRDIFLEGEAFFKVTKGSQFDVITSAGTVTVLGTQFNVKARENYFEVTCYEGSVSVTHKLKQTKLQAGDRFLILDGNYIATEKETAQIPEWLNNESAFKSMPLKNVIREFERQYQVKIITNEIDVNALFTGNFTHTNLEIALKSITQPMHLSYSKTNDTITLKRE